VNSDEPAFPTHDSDGNPLGGWGLTQREWFAGMALMGVCAELANRAVSTVIADRAKEIGVHTDYVIAEVAAKRADALIAELSREKP
jgi:hypothetical protein